MLKRKLIKLGKDEKGATIIEYGLLAAIIAIGLIGIWRQIGFDLRPIYDFLSGKIDEQVDAAEE